MDLSKATPEQISDYKNSWIEKAYAVQVGTGLDVKGKDWCRHKLARWCWSMKAFSDEGHHTFMFEHKENAMVFARDVLGIKDYLVAH